MTPLTFLLSIGCEDPSATSSIEALVESMVASRAIPFEQLTQSINAIKPLAALEGREFSKNMMTTLEDLAMLARR